jgi:alpha/beta superfamily hydrolase
MKETEVSFPCGELLLEGRLGLPEGPGPFPVVVVCHPHPLYGGSMDNNVVNSLCEALVSASLAALKFNFRGVGRSQGTHSQGVGEQEDVAAAVLYASQLAEADSERIGLAGYSAGAEYSHAVGVRDERVKALALISPPVTMSDFGALKDCLKPKFLVSGSRDDIIPVSQFLDFCRGLPEPKECHGIESADHFWWGHEKALAEKVTAFFTRAL